MSVLKKEFIDRMAENGGITKKVARQGVDLFFETLADYMSEDKETIMMLIRYAVKDKNSDICTTILNFLFKNYKDVFMECFIKGNELNVKIEAKSA